MSKKSTKHLVVYRCGYCSQDSAYIEGSRVACRFCKRTDRLTVISSDPATPQVIKARLEVIVDRMMSNLTSAYERLPVLEENIVSEGTDAESWLLRLMDKVKKLRDKVRRL